MLASPSDIANSLELHGLHKAYGQTVAVRRVDLEIDTPVYCCLLGPSGCGKTSLLRMIAGHEVIQENIARQGFSSSCAAVLSSGVPVLELEHNPEWSIDVLSGHIRKIESSSPDPAIILGCAGMTNIHARLQSCHTASLVDPVISAAGLIRALL